MPPILTVIGSQFAGCFAGAVLTENVFAWPGMGTMIVSAIDNRDYALIKRPFSSSHWRSSSSTFSPTFLYMVINPKVAAEAKKGGM